MMRRNEITVTDNSNHLHNQISFDERADELEKIKKREEREKHSPYNRWAQFNLEHIKELMWLGTKHPKAHAILLFLVDQMDEYNAVMCSYQVIQEFLNISRSTAARSIKTLKDNGFISVFKSGSSNVYAINDDLYWKSWGNNKKYSKFPANVVLSLSEQDEDYKEKFTQLKSNKVKEVNVK